MRINVGLFLAVAEAYSSGFRQAATLDLAKALKQMNAAWYYIEDDITCGPVTLAILAERLKHAEVESYFVWTEGMPDWVDAMTLPAISSRLGPTAAVATRAQRKNSIAKRIRHELVEYLSISLYLFICFGSLLFYKSAILQGEGVEYTAFSLAMVKALILGKFILLLQAMNAGERRNKPGILLIDVSRKSFLFLVLLVVLNAIEEVTLGLFHGRSAREVLGEMAGGTWPEAIAVCALLLLVLLPYFSFRGLASRLGDGVLWRHFTERF